MRKIEAGETEEGSRIEITMGYRCSSAPSSKFKKKTHKTGSKQHQQQQRISARTRGAVEEE
jgi:hypothetical protein